MPGDGAEPFVVSGSWWGAEGEGCSFPPPLLLPGLHRRHSLALCRQAHGHLLGPGRGRLRQVSACTPRSGARPTSPSWRAPAIPRSWSKPLPGSDCRPSLSRIAMASTGWCAHSMPPARTRSGSSSGSQVSIDDGSSIVLLARTGRDMATCAAWSLAVTSGTPREPAPSRGRRWRRAPAGCIALWLNDPRDSVPARSPGWAFSRKRSGIASTPLSRGIGGWTTSPVSAPRGKARPGSRSRSWRPPKSCTTSPDRRKLQDVLACIRHGTTLREAETKLYPNDEHALKSATEFAALYRQSPELVEASLEVADRCRFSFEELVYKYPDEVVPDGFTTATWLRHITYRRAQRSIPRATFRKARGPCWKRSSRSSMSWATAGTS